MDQRYPAMIEESRAALTRLLPGSAVGAHARPGAVRLQVSHPDLLEMVPQHGPGKKHEREIELTRWQREITHEHPRALLRGLIHSDGCRCVNRFRTKLPSGRVAAYEYPRYLFTNLSSGIRRIFTEHCELLGIRWTRSSYRNISISHRDSVARLDAFVGPKR